MEQFNSRRVLHVLAALPGEGGTKKKPQTCLVLKNVSISLKKVRLQM